MSFPSRPRGFGSHANEHCRVCSRINSAAIDPGPISRFLVNSVPKKPLGIFPTLPSGSGALYKQTGWDIQHTSYEFLFSCAEISNTSHPEIRYVKSQGLFLRGSGASMCALRV